MSDREQDRIHLGARTRIALIAIGIIVISALVGFVSGRIATGRSGILLGIGGLFIAGVVLSGVSAVVSR